MTYQTGPTPQIVDKKVQAVITATWNELRKIGSVLADLDSSVVRTLEKSGTSVSLNSTELFAKLNGLAGVIIGSGGIAGTDAAGASTFLLNASTGALTLSGTITAGAGAIGGFTIGADYIRDAANATFGLASTVTGGDDVRFYAGSSFANRGTAPARIYESGAVYFSSGTFTGSITGATNINVSGYVEAAGSVQAGSYYAAIIGHATAGSTSGVYGTAATNAYSGILGVASGDNYGVVGLTGSATYAGVRAVNSGSGPALEVIGPMTINNATLVTNLNAEKLGSSTLADIVAAANAAYVSYTAQHTLTVISGANPYVVTIT